MYNASVQSMYECCEAMSGKERKEKEEKRKGKEVEWKVKKER